MGHTNCYVDRGFNHSSWNVSFLKTEIGLALRATGDNEAMVKSFSAHTGNMKILGLAIGNALVAFSGSLVAQYNGFSDIGMGIGIIVIGLASVIIGEALFGSKTIARATLAVIGGAIIYRIVVTLALRVEFLDTGDVKLITALIVVGALVIPKITDKQKEKSRKKRRLKEIQMRHGGTLSKGGEGYASVKSDL